MSTRIYESVPGFFIQDNPDVIPFIVGAIPDRFGLIDTSTDRWTTFKSEIDRLKAKADNQTSYKVFFLGRHGEGFHNVAEAKYGPKAWDDYWSKLHGEDGIIWGPDPELTSVGKDQALRVRTAWESELTADIPLPEKFYCSPLTRAMQTNQLTFDGISTDTNRRTIIVENCREEYGEHTCDKRKSLTYIRSAFPHFQIEHGFKEEDELWMPDVRETKAQVAARAREVLDAIFTRDNETYISITAHGGFINGFLTNLDRKFFTLPVGGILPVVVKAVQA